MGNLYTEIIDIPNNKIIVKSLKNIISNQLGFESSYQRLTFQLHHKKIITLPDDFPLFFFNIKDYSVIFLEYFKNHRYRYNQKNDNRSPITMKYMNRLGYHLQYSRKSQSSINLELLELKSSSAHSNSNSYSEALSDDDAKHNDKNKNDNEDKDYELVLSNYIDSISFSQENEQISSTTKNKSKINNNESDILIKLIKKKDFDKIKSFFTENKFVISNEDINNNNIIDDEEVDSKNINNIDIKEEENMKKEFNICEKLNSNGWNSVHYVAYYGYSEILNFMLNNLNIKIDINIPNKDGYTPLLLATHKQNIKCIEILISNSNINANYLGPSGSAFHVACKKNNMKMASLLLYKSDIFLLDKNGKIPLEYTYDYNIKRLISKVVYKKLLKIKDKKSPEYKSISNFIDKYKNLLVEQKKIISPINLTEKYKFLRRISKFPSKPPFVYGYIEKSGRKMKIYRKRYIEINPVKGLLSRFKCKEDYPNSPNEILNLRKINKCIKIPMTFKDANEFCFTLTVNVGNEEQKNSPKEMEEKYMVHDSQVYDKWVDAINRSINYVKFWDKVKAKFSNIKNQIDEYLNELKYDKLHLDSITGEIKLYDINGKLKTVEIESDEEDEEEKEDKEDIEEIEDKENDNIKNETNTKIYNQTNELNINSININKNETLIEDASVKNGITFDSFEILSLLGSGSFGKVYKVKLKKTNEIFAMKIINKEFLIKKKLLKYAITECNILKQSKSPFIISLHYAFQTPENLYMIIDYCPGGDLNFHIQLNIFEEEEAKFYIAELILAIEYLHNYNILYRDLKPENILISSDGHIKLVDFGLAKENVKNNVVKSFCGSPSYLSPEMIQHQGASKATDIYGIGAVLFEMVSGTTPFYGNDLRTLYNNIAKKRLMFPEYFSDSIKDLLKKLLEKNPKKRISNTEEIKKHPFFKEIEWNEFEFKRIQPPLDLVKIKAKYDENLNFQKVNSVDTSNNDNIKEKSEKEFKDADYNEKNKYFRRIANFTFIRKNDSTSLP